MILRKIIFYEESGSRMLLCMKGRWFPEIFLQLFSVSFQERNLNISAQMRIVNFSQNLGSLMFEMFVKRNRRDWSFVHFDFVDQFEDCEK